MIAVIASTLAIPLATFQRLPSAWGSKPIGQPEIPYRLENKAVEVAVDPGEYTLMGSYIVWVPRLKEYGSLEARLAVGTYYRVVKSGEVVQLIQTPCRSKIEAYDSILEIVKNGFLSTHYVEGSTTERFGNWSSGLAYGLVGPVRSCNLLLGLAKVHRYGPHGRQH